MAFEGFPFIIGWEVTLLCNLRCRHCGSSAGRKRNNELDGFEALDICNQFPALLVREVDFTGGEPLLSPVLPRIAARLNDLGVRTSILSHGTGYGAGDISKIRDLGIAGVGISLDGLEDTHDYIRRKKGAFKSVLKTIDLIHQAGLILNVITTVNSMNLKELPGLYHVLNKHNVSKWRLQVLIPMGRAGGIPALRLPEDSMLQLGMFIQQNTGENALLFPEIACSDGLQYIIPSERPWKGCAAGIVACGITSDGKVKGCLSMPDDMIEGDLRQNSLWDIWFNKDSFKNNREYAATALGPYCKGCSDSDECKGGCTSSSYICTRRFHNDPYCFKRISQKSEILPTTA